MTVPLTGAEGNNVFTMTGQYVECTEINLYRNIFFIGILFTSVIKYENKQYLEKSIYFKGKCFS
jgi:hypothetical protein